VNEVSPVKKYIAIGLMALTIIISVGGSVLLIQHWEYVTMLESQGLLGLFLIAIFAGSPIPVPSPSMILTFTMGSIFNPALVALVSSLGNTTGNSLVYLTGRGGLAFFKNLGLTGKSNKENGNKDSLKEGNQKPGFISRIRNKLTLPRTKELARKHALWAVFILGMYPNPLMMPVVMGMGATRYSFWKFFVVCWAGKMVESLVLSYLGYFGLRSILHYFGLTLP
jgi:membrane protein YqaA with SNARE-associated domain